MAGRDLKQLFRAFNERDELAFRRAAQAIIHEEEAKQHLALARDLRRGPGAGAGAGAGAGGGAARSAGASALSLPEPPADRDGGWPLADVREPTKGLDDLIVSHSLE